MNNRAIQDSLSNAKANRDAGVKLRVLLPCNSQIFNRISQNMPKGTQMRTAGTATFEGNEYQVVEFFKPRTNEH